MSTKEQVLAAAKLRFATKEIFLNDDKSVSVTVRELLRAERDKLNQRLFVCDEATGKPVSVNAKGEPDPKGDEWKYREGVLVMEEWLSASLTPAFTVEELQGPDWPASLKRTLYNETMALNGVTIRSAAGN